MTAPDRDATEPLRGFSAHLARWGWGAPLVLALLLWLPGLAGGSIINGDDAIYGLVLRRILRGDGIAEALGWRPPLFYLLGVASTRTLGFTELALRLPSLLAGLLAVTATWWAGRALWRTQPAVAFWAATLMASCGQVGMFARRVRGLDLLLAAILTASVALAAQPSRAPRRRWALVGAGLGLAIWTKSVVVVTVGPALAVLWWTSENSTRARGESAGIVAAVAGVMAGAWVAWTKLFGAGMGDHLQNHVARRAVDADMVAAEQTPLTFYVDTLFELEGATALAMLAGVAVLAFLTARRDRSAAVVVAWAIGVFVPFSLAATKLPHYILPAYPALALAFAAALFAVRDRVAPVLLHVLAGALVAYAVLLGPFTPLDARTLDHSPHLQAAARSAEETIGPEGTLAIWNEYHVAASLYYPGHALLWTDNDGFEQAYGATHGFAEGTHYRRVPLEDVAAELRAAAPACVFARDSPRSSALDQMLGAAGLAQVKVEGGWLRCAR